MTWNMVLLLHPLLLLFVLGQPPPDQLRQTTPSRPPPGGTHKPETPARHYRIVVISTVGVPVIGFYRFQLWFGAHWFFFSNPSKSIRVCVCRSWHKMAGVNWTSVTRAQVIVPSVVPCAGLVPTVACRRWLAGVYNVAGGIVAVAGSFWWKVERLVLEESLENQHFNGCLKIVSDRANECANQICGW